jgi:hypothetical protein
MQIFIQLFYPEFQQVKQSKNTWFCMFTLLNNF